MGKNDIPETIVSTGMKIEGELKSNGNVRIDGIVAGKVQTSQDLVIGPTAQIDGDLIAVNALIAGRVKGNVTVKNSLSIMETGRISGNLSCSTISIREGGFFSGQCLMKEPKSEPQIKPEPNPKIPISNI